MEGEDPSTTTPSEDRESILTRTNKWLWRALAGMSMIYVATGAAVVGDATDFLRLGSPPAAEASKSAGYDDGRPLLTTTQLTDRDLTAEDDDEPSDTGCIDQIRIDAGNGSLIEFVGERSAPFPNARTEYYSAATTSGELHYACTIVLPDQITLARLGSRPATGAPNPAVTEGTPTNPAATGNKS